MRVKSGYLQLQSKNLDLLPFPLAELQIFTVWSLLPDAR